MAEIRLTGINKIYPGGTHAVHDVDLHIADGEFMIMVGPSGCAKSTILRMVAGLEVPTSGTVEIGGRVVNDVAPKDRDIAMVFQSYALYPHMTVRENMAFGLRLRRMPPTEIDQRVAEAARILGLEHLLDRLPKAMSGGQRQRVAMGRAIVREPQAFLMDEPLSNLDAKLRVQMRTEIAKLHQRLGVTTMYVTHDQVEALTLGQRICILRKGIIQQVDTPFQVYTNPANIFVGGFIGSPGMNFMNGHLLLHEGMLYLQIGQHHIPVPASVSARLLATTDVHGRGVIVGIRPEHMSMSTSDDAAAIPVNVELTEAMGAEVYAYFTASVSTPDLTQLSDTQATAETFVARLGAGADAHAGGQIWLRPELDEVHLFDPQTMLTMLAPAEEMDVRARQAGTAIEIASGMHAIQSPVATPPSTSTNPQPAQPVVHVHQTFVQPEGMPAMPAAMHGTMQSTDAVAIASVFDQQVASPVHLEPLMPAVVGGHSEQQHAHATPAQAHPRPTFASGIAAGTSLDPQPVVSEASQPAPVAEAPRGFAPRPIGPQDIAPDPVLRATPAALDDAIASTETPAPAPTPRPLGIDGPPSAFRDTLARIRRERLGSAQPLGRIGTVLPPRVTLAPAPGAGVAADAQEPSQFRMPRLGGEPADSQ